MPADRPRPRAGILDIAPYVPGKSGAPGVAKVWKLSSNETPLGPSPRARAAFAAAAAELELYPDGSSARAARGDRRAATASIRRESSAAPARTNCCPSSPTPICRRATRPCSAPTASSSTRSPPWRPARCRWRRRRVNLTADVDAILARVTARTKIVFLANPNNPTGTYLPFDEVKRLHAGLPARHPAGARRRLCRICPAQRLRGRARARRHGAKRRDDAHLLEDPRPRRAAARLDGRAGAS